MVDNNRHTQGSAKSCISLAGSPQCTKVVTRTSGANTVLHNVTPKGQTYTPGEAAQVFILAASVAKFSCGRGDVDLCGHKMGAKSIDFNKSHEIGINLETFAFVYLAVISK